MFATLEMSGNLGDKWTTGTSEVPSGFAALLSEGEAAAVHGQDGELPTWEAPAHLLMCQTDWWDLKKWNSGGPEG